jgi:hypothetical protein
MANDGKQTKAEKAAARIYQLWYEEEYAANWTREDKVRAAAALIESRCGNCPEES